jgi:DNA-binding beta-propeller fold protein YncE
MLFEPRGIFVNTNLDLYVADYANHRIQLFPPGQFNGLTVANTSNTITLNYPTGVVLDADNYLYIVDQDESRILGSGPNGLRCLVGCDTGRGSASNQLKSPQRLAFDSFGNIYVTDTYNYRIQKFVLSSNTCSKYYSEPKTRKLLCFISDFLTERNSFNLAPPLQDVIGYCSECIVHVSLLF